MTSPDSTPVGLPPGLEPGWIVRAVPDGLWMFDDQGRTTYANAHMASMLGIGSHEVVGYSVFDALDEQGRSDFRHHLAARGQAVGGEDVECCLHGRDGRQWWTLVTHAEVLDDDGTHHGWMYRVRDHTEPRRVLNELRRRDRQFAEAQRVAGVGTWERELSTGRVEWSAEVYRLCGVDRDVFEPTAEAFFALLHPDDRGAATVAYARLISDDEPVDVECRLATALPRETWLRVRGFISRAEDGTVLRVGGTIQDITVSKDNELGLRFLGAMGAAANESHTLAEVLIAAEAHVRPYARWPAVLVGVPATGSGRRSGGSVDDLAFIDLEWTNHDEGGRAFARELAHEAVVAGKAVQRPGPGGIVMVAGPVLSDNQLACVIVSDTEAASLAGASDVAFFEQMLVLLAQVAEREHAAAELGRARDEALSASRAKSEFLATMSHEIRTPLNGVIGLSELLRRTELDGHQQRLASGVDDAARTLLALVNDILDLSKIEAGRLDLEEVDFDPRTVLEQSAGLVADRARDKSLELLVSSAADVPLLVRGDQVRFGQVVTNLAANAVKFTSEGEVVIRASMIRSELGARLRVEVRDTGVGIALESQAALFDAFTQADSSTTRQFGGTGLGLTISKRIISAMGGNIGVESAVGVGSTFWFEVAFSEPHEVGGHADERLHAENAVSGLRVLVVDDNATNRFILTEQLSAWDVQVAAVDSTYGALVELDSSFRGGAPYDIVLLDYMMPGADGEQLARIVRAQDCHAQTKLVLLSSAVEPTSAWLSAAGIDAFMSKPVLPSRLLDTLADLGGRLEAFASSGAVAGVGTAALETHGRGRILVVEDNAINQLVAEGVLARLGFEVVMADNGAAGVAAVADDPDGYAAILMDCQMPVMDGFDATRAVRAIQTGGARTPIIAMTAAAVAEERERCLAAGMDDFLTKPVDVAQLGAALDRWTGDSSRRQINDSGRPSGGVSAQPAGSESPPVTGSTFDVTAANGVGLSDRLDDLLADDVPAAVVARMVDNFRIGSQGVLEKLAAAAERGHAAEVASHAHALRGSASNLGLTDVAALARRVELFARDEDTVDSVDTEVVHQLRNALALGCDLLVTYAEARLS